MIKTLDQFQDQGCDNCARLLNIREDKERVLTTTSSRVSGFIAMMDPSKSWVARYQRLQPSFVPGVYAVSVKGALTEDVAELLDEANYQYVSRDFFDRSLKK
jgi:transcription elongation factor SPT4